MTAKKEKHMTTEEKAKAYDEALKDMMVIYPNLKGDAKLAVEHAFPELRESEDERIRKVLVDMVKRETGFTGFPSQGQVLAYLEKQKDLQFDYPGIYFYDGEKLHFQGNPATEENPYDFAMSQQEKQKEQVIDETDKIAAAYQLGRSDERRQKEPEKEELVYRLNGLMQEYINEAKDQEEEEHRFKCYKLFWNALEDASYFEQKEQRPAWSEEDEKMLSDLRNTLGCLMNAGAITFKTKKKFSNWLKSLRPSWKPSEDQMEALEIIVRYGDKESASIKNLTSLYEQLKKL